VRFYRCEFSGQELRELDANRDTALRLVARDILARYMYPNRLDVRPNVDTSSESVQFMAQRLPRTSTFVAQLSRAHRDADGTGILDIARFEIIRGLTAARVRTEEVSRRYYPADMQWKPPELEDVGEIALGLVVCGLAAHAPVGSSTAICENADAIPKQYMPQLAA